MDGYVDPRLPVLRSVPTYRCNCGREFLRSPGARLHIEQNPEHDEDPR